MRRYLGPACRTMREAAGIRLIDVATTADTSEGTLSRFERGHWWPKDPDAWITAYAIELDLPPAEFWRVALETWLRSEP